MSSSGDRDYNLFSVTERERARAIEWVRSDVQWGGRERERERATDDISHGLHYSGVSTAASPLTSGSCCSFNRGH